MYVQWLCLWPRLWGNVTRATRAPRWSRRGSGTATKGSATSPGSPRSEIRGLSYPMLLWKELWSQIHPLINALLAWQRLQTESRKWLFPMMTASTLSQFLSLIVMIPVMTITTVWRTSVWSAISLVMPVGILPSTDGNWISTQRLILRRGARSVRGS